MSNQIDVQKLVTSGLVVIKQALLDSDKLLEENEDNQREAFWNTQLRSYYITFANVKSALAEESPARLYCITPLYKEYMFYGSFIKLCCSNFYDLLLDGSIKKVDKSYWIYSKSNSGVERRLQYCPCCGSPIYPNT